MNIISKLRAATPTPTPPPAPTQNQPAEQSDMTEAAAWCFAQHAKRQGPAPAKGEGHNNWLTAVTKFCNESGANLADVLALALDTAPAGHDEAKIRATVKGIYHREAAAHNSKPFIPLGNQNHTEATHGASQSAGEPPEMPPTFPAAVYEALPSYLRRCCEPFTGHERAVMLLGTLAVLSGCFPAVGGEYGRRRFGLNLFVFVIAPAASGKGTLAWARRLGYPWHKRLTDESRAARAEYEAELATHRAASKGKANVPPPTAPPPHKLLYLPGNTTAAALATALSENDGRGIICETEADTLSGALGADFGNFSDVLRKSFQHEPAPLLRKTDRQHLDLAHPALSIALTGTPGQLPRLMPTAEDGLVSRFLFYVFEQPPVWQDVSPAAGPPLTPTIDALADELSRMIETAPVPEEPGRYAVEITLNPTDWQRLNAAGQVGLDEATELAGGTGASTAFRLGLIAWRIAGLLTVLRFYENGEAPTGCLQADPADVSTALAIMDTARAHALTVLKMLPTPGNRPRSKSATKASQQAQVHELHKQGLSYREIAEQVGISFKTVGNWLKDA